MKKALSIIAVGLFIVTGLVMLGYAQDSENTAASTDMPDAATHSITIHELKQSDLTEGRFYIEGYVAKIYTCPPCPEGTQCKPCMGDNIVVSEDKKEVGGYGGLSPKELIVFTDKTGELKLGGKYQFFVKVLNEKTTLEPVNNVQLIEYKTLN